jgi:hypothetical protein
VDAILAIENQMGGAVWSHHWRSAGQLFQHAAGGAAACTTAFDAEQWLAIHRETDLTASALEFRNLCHANCLAMMLRQ